MTTKKTTPETAKNKGAKPITEEQPGKDRGKDAPPTPKPNPAKPITEEQPKP